MAEHSSWGVLQVGPVDRRGTVKANISVIVVDTQPLFRRGLRNLCEALPGIGSVIEATTAEDALERVRLGNIGMVICDLTLPRNDGIWLLYEVRSIMPDLPVIFCSSLSSPEMVLATMQAGANGFLTKSATSEEMRLAIWDIQSGRSYIHSTVAQFFIDRVRDKPEGLPDNSVQLTSREREILELVAEGVSTNDLSERLYLSLSTVKTHLRALYRKFEVSSRTQLALKALAGRQAPD